MNVGDLVRLKHNGRLGIILLGCHPVMNLVYWFDDGKQVYTNPSFYTVIA